MVASEWQPASPAESPESWVLDQLPTGIVITTAELFVLTINRFARELIDSAAGIAIKDRRLTCVDTRSQQRLEQRIRGMQKAVGATTALRVTRDAVRPDLQMRVAAALTSPQLSGAAEPRYWIWIFDPSTQRKIDAGLIRELHGLTPTESVVAAALFRNCSLEEVAIEFGVTVNTVKTHLKHIFQKCEVKSQAELLQMLALGPR